MKRKLNKSNILLIFLIILALAGITRLVFLTKELYCILKEINKPVEDLKIDKVYNSNETVESIFGKYYSENEYISDKENAKYFIDKIEFSNGTKEVYIAKLFDIEKFDNELKEIDYEAFINILRDLNYKSIEAQDPNYILRANSNYSNCSTSTLFIYEWLKVNLPPKEYKYSLKIGEKDSSGEFDKHMYIQIVPKSKPSFIIDYDKSGKLINLDKLIDVK